MSNSNLGQIGLGIVGAVGGFFLGGIPAAVMGFSLGFSVGGLIFPPDAPKGTKTNDEFSITAATEGSPVAIVYGRRRVKGNIIYFGNVDVDEIQNGGKGFGGGGSQVVETRPFAPIHITLAVDTLYALHGIYDGKGRDWQALNTSYNGAPVQISTGSGTDFNYSPTSTPLPGITSIFSSRFFLGENARNMTPLDFDIEIRPSALFGDPTQGMPAGAVNPIAVLYSLWTHPWIGRQNPAYLDTTQLQEAWNIFRDEGRGIAPKLEGQQTDLKNLMRAICDHTNSLDRISQNGKIQLYPLRDFNYTPISIDDADITDLQITSNTWDKVKNSFAATFADPTKNYDPSTVEFKNQAVIEMMGRIELITYNFDWFIDRDNAMRRILEYNDELSFPAPIIAFKLSNRFHTIRRGDVVVPNLPNQKLIGIEFRVLSVQYADFGKEGITVKARMMRKRLGVSYTPPVAEPAALPPINEPQTPLEVGGLATYWRFPHCPPPPKDPPPDFPTTGGPTTGGGVPYDPGSPGALSPLMRGVDEEGIPYFGYELLLWAARAAGRDIGYVLEAVHAKQSQLPVAVPARTTSTRWAFYFTTETAIAANEWRYASDSMPLLLKFFGYAGQTFGLQNQNSVDANGFKAEMETSRYGLVVGGTELWLWERYTYLGNNVYAFYGLIRSSNKEWLYSWPAQTPCFVVDLREPVPQSQLAYGDWAHRQRWIDIDNYNNGSILARVRAFAVAADLHGQVQAPDEGYGGPNGKTFQSRTGAKAHASNLYAPLNEIMSNRAPMPTCQGFKKNQGYDYRSWYAIASGFGANDDWLIEFPPFPDDVTGIGDGIAYDKTQTIGHPFGPPVEVFESRPHLGTDYPFDDFVGANSRCNGQTYRLFIMSSISLNPLVDAPTRTIDITFNGSETKWPSFMYTVEQQGIDGLNSNNMALWVAVKGINNAWCRPRLVGKLGPYQNQIETQLTLAPS